MKKLTLLITLIVIASTAATISAKRGRGPEDRHKTGFNIDRLSRALELTDEQADQIQQLHYENKKSAIDLKSTLEKNRLEMHNMVATNNIEESEILNLASGSSKIHAELKSNKIKLWLDVYKLLNPEQQEKWTKFFQGMGDRTKMRADRMKHKRIREHAPEFPKMD